MKIAKLYSNGFGESHSEDIDIHLALTDYVPSSPPLKPAGKISVTQFSFMKAPAQWTIRFALLPASC